MPESIIKRVKRLISASINDVMDSIEKSNGLALMRQTIREIDDAIREIDERLGNIGAELVRMENMMKWLKSKHEEKVKKLELALRKNREDLAEMVIGEQMQIEEEQAHLKKSMQRLMDEAKELQELRHRAVSYRHDLAERYQAWKAAHPEVASEVTDEIAPNETLSPFNEAAFEKIVRTAEETFLRATGQQFKPDAEKIPERVAHMQELDQLAREEEIRRRLEEARQRLAS
ncbi:PspA/IM30 family protein [Thermopetrobacter sp. TC1]|uniref:PspA/IM30 family protein n=1 Tax=Thermopetrobacter sp. TC1 TaxID=1495045 RepID=UPI00056E5FD2|nr:PspA/IM30 family protein [Thermopetrobacter sp. TC1]